jgi:CBS domain-containing membrane protein
METLRVSSVMSSPVISVEPDHSLSFAAGIMNLKRVRHLPVCDAGQLVGLVSQRDVMAAQAAELATPQEMSVPVARIMKTDVWTVSPETPVLEAALIMVDHRYGCLPVLHEGRLVGIVTAIDLMRLLVKGLQNRRDREATQPQH